MTSLAYFMSLKVSSICIVFLYNLTTILDLLSQFRLRQAIKNQGYFLHLEHRFEKNPLLTQYQAHF